MSLLDTVETNKQLENELDKIVIEELRDIYHQADVKAFAVRAKLHDSDKDKELAPYNLYRIENRNLRKDMDTVREALKQSRQEISDLYANKTVLLALIGEMFGVISHNSTEHQKDILTQTLKRELGDIDFARMNAYKKRLGLG